LGTFLAGTVSAQEHIGSNPIPLGKSNAAADVTLESVRALTETNNAYGADAYPFVSGDGLRVYYVTESNYMKVASRTSVTGQFGTPGYVSGLSTYLSRGCWLTPDELTIYFISTSGTLYRAVRTSRSLSFSYPSSVTLSGCPSGFISAPSLSPDENELLLFHSPTAGDSIIRFVRSSSTLYTYSGKVAAFSRTGEVGPGQLSKDGLRFYVPVKTPTHQLRAYSRASLSAAWDAGMTVATTTRVIHPTVTADESVMLFAYSSDNGWSNHDLYEGRLSWPSALRLIQVPSPTYNRRPTFAWRPVDEPSQYTLQIADNEHFTDPIVALPMTDTSYTPAVDLPIGPIYWRVRSHNRPYSSSSFSLLDNRVPILIPYEPDITLERRPSLHWHRVGGASSYTIAIYASDNSATSSEDFETGDFSKLPWRHSGNAYWTITSSDSYEGTYSARSGAISNSEYSTLAVTRSCVAGSISFYRRVSSESYSDYLRFYIDDVEQDSWSGTGSDMHTWTLVSYPVTAGEHTFTWKYSKNWSSSYGSDAAWIDQIRFPSDNPTLVLAVPVTDTFYDCTADLPVGVISWKVKSDLVETYSEPDRFEILTDTIPFLYRYDGDTVTSRRPRFRWHPVPGATAYTIALSNTSDFASPLLVLPVTDTSYVATFDLTDGDYYWKVSSNRNGVYAAPDRLVVQGSTATDLPGRTSAGATCGMRMLNRHGTMHVAFNGMPGQNPILYVYRQDGRLVFRATMTATSGVVDIGSAARLPTGSYIAVMKAGGAVLARKTLFVK